MSSFRKSLLAAILKHLLRGKSLIQSVFAFWISPLSSPQKAPSSTQSSTQSSTATPGAVDGTGQTTTIPPAVRSSRTARGDFLREAEALLLGPLAGDGLLRLSRALKAQFRERLQSDPACMLPSYNHRLPRGHETGRYLAVDVGGSTLRVALVELRGQGEDVRGRESEIVSMKSYPIGMDVKSLRGVAFFDWMAARIVETLEKESRPNGSVASVLPMALAWSFPIEQTSLRGGLIHDMGKGFRAADGLVGEDLGAVIEAACRRSALPAELCVILNDGNATLLSCAYLHNSTRFGLILGTGVNIAAYLPVPLIGSTKFGDRPKEWFDEARSVIVNTELGMFGKDILPVTRWDALLKKGHSRPDFQPLEQMVGGMYLGEIARFALLEAIRTTGVFGGIVPESLNSPYSFGTETMSLIEGDVSLTMEKSISLFSKLHPSPHIPTALDMAFLRDICALISRRSAAIVAASLHAVWELRLEGIRESMASSESSAISTAEAEKEVALERTMVSFNGSVIESYPGYRAMCQQFVDELVAAGGDGKPGARIDLVPAKESSLLGAGVALAAAVSEAA
ncbi:actin-like ATPase domain-containing protein [Sodiomyces alkalinus F11]|uniref:Phosphotransferase n=1 Tax=Sodiomyces alkalinus (strain CBS 110278 / VKM F-3762 / F11) TaxID=1314773 RepID=A0A3N2PP49_SODAK|nr:actin-like ATPase domain-containing protein [Sodiomyces alkalinus F11]ROT36282.1 actin-like ATPase domain-containing protein [Sodiomyces alkalinus F11]